MDEHLGIGIEGATAYGIRLENFEGPLDLLLHLIEKQELDVTEVSILEVTDQYLAYLHAMEELDLDVASEFLVMAARLLEIKAKTLLPPPRPEETFDGEDDPRAELVRRLLEYRQFKEAADHLRERGEQEGQRFPRFPQDLEALEGQVELDGVTVADLLVAMERVLREAAEEEAVVTIERERLTLAESMRRMRWQLRRAGGRMTFQHLFAPGSTRLEIVVTFLALLELLRSRRVRAVQEQLFGPIEIALLASPAADQAAPAADHAAGEGKA